MNTKFVDVRSHRFIAEPRYFFYGWTPSPKIIGRESTVKALVNARRLLPKGFNFKIWDCKRTYLIQQRMMESFRRRLHVMHPTMSAERRRRLLVKFSGGLVKSVTRLDTHRRGGSLDLTIVDRNGVELFMGTDHDDLTANAAMDFYETTKRPTKLDLEARKNRRLLSRVMRRAGFINYAPEWWHWSFDR